MCVCVSIDVFAYQLVLPIVVNIPGTKLYSLALTWDISMLEKGFFLGEHTVCGLID